MLRIEVLIGVIASAIAILTFMARAYANIRKGRRIKRYAHGIDRRSTEELERLREELEAAQEMSAERRGLRKDG
jgi:hypothetical protein